jgi:hypothetical protein
MTYEEIGRKKDKYAPPAFMAAMVYPIDRWLPESPNATNANVAGSMATAK